ncbi:hypothetical protein BZA77DRAFT_300211 [Pyronema omphalodes]|nr:hypothetical protein BZA77DRAFT_300211 [Pyronema omphalodes]
MNSSEISTIILGILATVFTAIGAIEGIGFIIRYFKVSLNSLVRPSGLYLLHNKFNFNFSAWSSGKSKISLRVMLMWISQKRCVQRQQISRADIEAVPMMPQQEHRQQHEFQLPRTPTVVLSNVYIFGATVGSSPVEEIRIDTMAGRVDDC